MLKLLSVKTRLPGTTRAAFRRHYEERHVPLGLGFIDRFRWRKYARNHVVAVQAGAVDFDCLTEFWFGSPADHEATRAFAATPEFRVLDEDDERFLDVTRRLSFPLEEHSIAGDRPAHDAVGTRRFAAIFACPEPAAAGGFAQSISAEARRIAASPGFAGTRVSLDLRAATGPRPSELAAIVSSWSAPGSSPVRLSGWSGHAPYAEIELEVVETPAERLWSPS